MRSRWWTAKARWSNSCLTKVRSQRPMGPRKDCSPRTLASLQRRQCWWRGVLARAVGGGERAFVRQEFDHLAFAFHQRDRIGAVLDAIDGITQDDDAAVITCWWQATVQQVLVVYGSVAAVVEHELKARDVGAWRALDLDGLARIGADVVVVELVMRTCAATRELNSKVLANNIQRAAFIVRMRPSLSPTDGDGGYDTSKAVQ